MNTQQSLVVFLLDGWRYALPLASVDRVVRAVEVTPLPDAPEAIFGVIDVEGEVIPVVNTRRRFRLPEVGIRVGDQFIIARIADWRAAFVVDAVEGVLGDGAERRVKSDSLLPGIGAVEGFAVLQDGLILVQDLKTLKEAS